MEERAFGQIEVGMEVCDVGGHKIGSVAHLHEGQSAPGGQIDGGYVEVKTGFLGLGAHLFVPFDAVREVTEGGVILAHTRDEVKQMGWDARPADLAPAAPGHQEVRPAAAAGGASTASPAQPSAGAAADPDAWEAAAPRFRARWQEHYGARMLAWEQYEPRYRFAWEMQQHPEFRGRSWVMAQPALRQRWQAQHPDQEWDQVSDSVRDAWEHAADGEARLAAGQSDRAA
jgi:hypothetical protein